MSRHHNTKHPERVEGGYRRRLQARGLSKAPTMEELETLQKRQTNRVRATCTVGENHDGHECNGSPFPSLLATDES
jgi:hypothetical protein